MEWNRNREQRNGKMVKQNIGGVNETMGRTRVNKSCNRRKFRIGVRDRNYRYMEGIRIRKSRCIEVKLCGHITKFNMISSECRVLEIATYFFESLAAAAATATA